MRLATLAIAFVVALFCLMTPANAANPDRVTQLVESRRCVGCDLHGADLHGKDLRGVDLTRANLRNADLSGANMMAVNMHDADLQGANLEGATVLAANFMGANLKDATLGHISLDSSRFCHTTIPSGKVSDRDC